MNQHPIFSIAVLASAQAARLEAPADRHADLTADLVRVLADVAFQPVAVSRPSAVTASDDALALLKARLPAATVAALAAGKWSADLARRIAADLSVSRQA